VSPGRVIRLAGRELRDGIRSPLVLMAFLVPMVITVLARTVMPMVLDPEPCLAVVDSGSSGIPDALESQKDLRILRPADEAALERILDGGDADAGLVLPPGFDEALRAGERPLLDLRFPSGEARSQGLMASLIVLGAARDLSGDPGDVAVTLRVPGGRAPLSDRILPAVVIFVMIVAGIMTPAFLLVQERERGTLQALLVTPAGVSEVILSKALLGAALTLAASLLTLVLNGIRPAHPWAMLAVLATGTWICVGIGMLYGSVAGSARSLYTLVKSLNILIAAPVLFYIFPVWPRWIARLFPTWWFLDPLYRVALHGESLSDIAASLAVSAGVGLTLTLASLPLGRRMARKAAGG